MYIDDTVKIPTELPATLQCSLDELLYAYRTNDLALFFCRQADVESEAKKALSGRQITSSTFHQIFKLLGWE